MAIDINARVERRGPAGWEPLDGGPNAYGAPAVEVSWVGARDYDVIELLGGVAGRSAARDLVPIVATPRGLPGDLSAQLALTDFGYRLPSWVSLAELWTYDWRQPVTVAVLIEEDDLPAGTDARLRAIEAVRRSLPDSELASGHRYLVSREQEWLANGEDERSVMVEHLVPVIALAGELVRAMVWMTMVAGGDLEAVRLVYGFF